jgi:hypothetical protein
MSTLVRFRLGRVLLHLLAMAGDRCVQFHIAGIVRELPWAVASVGQAAINRCGGAATLH